MKSCEKCGADDVFDVVSAGEACIECGWHAAYQRWAFISVYDSELRILPTSLQEYLTKIHADRMEARKKFVGAFE